VNSTLLTSGVAAESIYVIPLNLTVSQFFDGETLAANSSQRKLKASGDQYRMRTFTSQSVADELLTAPVG